MRHRLTTEIYIEAEPQAVWDTLVALDDYADWNPFIVTAEGDVAVGERLRNRMEPPGGQAVTFKPKVTEVEPGATFEWLGRLGLPGVFDGRHRFETVPEGAGTRLLHTEEMSGILVRPLRKSLDNHTLPGFEAMNTALKARVEAAVGSAS